MLSYPDVLPISKEGAAIDAHCCRRHCLHPGEIMIGPPGLPKYGRRVFSFAAAKQSNRDKLVTL